MRAVMPLCRRMIHLPPILFEGSWERSRQCRQECECVHRAYLPHGSDSLAEEMVVAVVCKFGRLGDVRVAPPEVLNLHRAHGQSNVASTAQHSTTGLQWRRLLHA